MVSDRQPAWSPDGNKIAFFSVLDEDDILAVINVDGTNHRNLTEEVLNGFGSRPQARRGLLTVKRLRIILA